MDPYDRHTAAIMDGHAVIAEHAARDLKAAGILTDNLDFIAKHYRDTANTMRTEPTDFISVEAIE